MKNLMIFVSLLFLFNACAKKTFKIMPEYEGMNFIDNNLAVIIIDEPVIVNYDDVEDDIGTEPDAYLNFFKNYFSRGIKKNSIFTNVEFPILSNDIEYEKIDIPLNDDKTFKFKTPKTGQISELTELDFNFILFISKLQVSRIFVGSYNMYGGGGSEYLLHKTEFYVWDNNNHKIVSYGSTEDQTSLFLAMTDKTWKRGIQDLAKNVMKATPFYKKSSSKHTY